MKISLEELPAPAIIHRRSGIIIEFNSLFREILQKARLDLSTHNVDKILPEKYCQRYKENIGIATKEFTFTWDLGGKNIDYYVTVRQVEESSEQQDPQFIFLFTQTTEIIDKIYATKYEHNLLRTVIDILPSFIYAKDKQSRFIMSNQVLAGYMNGSQPEDVIGKTDFDFFPHKLALKFYCDDQEVINTGKAKIRVLEPSIVKDSKSEHWVSTTKVPLRNQEGEIIGIVGTGTDVTREKQIQDHLEELENIVNNSKSCAFLIEMGEKWEVIYYSKNVNLFGYETDDFSKENLDIRSIIHPDDLDKVIQETESNFKNNITDFTHEFRLLSRSGKIRWVEDHKCLRKQTETGTMIYQSLITDITRRHEYEAERVSMELQLRQAQKLEAIGQLAAGISHEINTPIQFISDNLKFLNDSFEDFHEYISFIEKNVSKHLSNIESLNKVIGEKSEELDIKFIRDEIPSAIAQSLEGAVRVRDIVKAMKEFSHSGSGEIELVNVNEAIKSTVTVARNEWKYVSDVEIDLDPLLPEIPVDVGPFKQTILNLIVNAAHAIEDRIKTGETKKGTISICTQTFQDHMLMTVKDTGKGIPENIANRIYEPFFTTKEVGKGTGQGLAIAYDIIVRKLNGKLYFKTKNGEGTTFFIELPFAEND